MSFCLINNVHICCYKHKQNATTNPNAQFFPNKVMIFDGECFQNNPSNLNQSIAVEMRKFHGEINKSIYYKSGKRLRSKHRIMADWGFTRKVRNSLHL